MPRGFPAVPAGAGAGAWMRVWCRSSNTRRGNDHDRTGSLGLRGGTAGRVAALQAELGAAGGRDQVGVLGVAGDEGAGERADRDHGLALLAGLAEHGGDQVAAEAPAAEPRVGLGVDEGELVAGAAVIDEAAQFPVGLDFIAGPLGMIFDLLSHDSRSRQLTRPSPPR